MKAAVSRFLPLAVFLMLAAWWAAPAAAQEVITPTSTSVSDEELDRRIEFITQRLEASQLHGQIWHYGWLTVKTANLGVSTFNAIDSSNENTQLKHSVDAVVSTLGVAGHYLDPVEARFGADRFSGMPQDSRSDRIAKLHEAERQLIRNAEKDAARWGWVNQGANLAVATTSALIVGFFGDPDDAAPMFATNFLGGLLNTATEPWEGEEDLERYNAFVNRRPHTTEVGLYFNAMEDGAKGGVKFTW